MAKKLEDAVGAVARLVGAIPGMRGSPTEPPEKITQFPFAVTAPSDGEWTPRMQNDFLGIHRIGIWVYVGRRDLPRATAQVIPYGELVKGVLLASANTMIPDAAGQPTADAILALRYAFGPMGYVTVPMLGWAFELEFKILTPNGA